MRLREVDVRIGWNAPNAVPTSTLRYTETACSTATNSSDEVDNISQFEWRIQILKLRAGRLLVTKCNHHKSRLVTTMPPLDLSMLYWLLYQLSDSLIIKLRTGISWWTSNWCGWLSLLKFYV